MNSLSKIQHYACPLKPYLVKKHVYDTAPLQSRTIAKSAFILILVITILFVGLITPQLSIAEIDLATYDYHAYQTSKYASPKWDNLVKAGIENFHSGNYDEAQNLLYKAFNLGCESPIVTFMLALLSEYKNAFYSALEYYQLAKKGFKKSNQNHRYHQTFDENYGRALYNSGKQDEALPILTKAAKNSNSYWLLKLMGMISYEQGDTLNAVSYFERAVRIKSPDVTNSELVYVYTLLAKLFLAKGERDGAHRYFQKVIELDPNNQEANEYMRQIEKSYSDKKMENIMEKLKDY